MRWARIRTGKPFALPLPALSRPQPYARPPRCVADYSDRLVRAETAGDAIVALEVLAEASAVKATITPVAAEAGARAVSELSASRAWKAVQLHVLDKGEQPCFKSTIPLLAKALSKAEDNEGFNGLLEAVEPHLLSVCAEKTEYSIEEQHECMRCMNVMLRMQGKLNVDGAVEKLNRYHKVGIIIEGSTYTSLAASSLTAGNFPQAEDLLEMRDYL